jgi:RNA-directed DNA polymerase
VKDRTEYGIGAEGTELAWNLMPWDFIEKSIRKLRQRIFRAIREERWNDARNLMKLMLRSYFNLLSSVRRVSQTNKGKKTPGVDGELALTPQARMSLVRRMGKHTLWKVKPVRRLYIPKAGKPGQERPLGIPTIRDRVAQSIVKNALEPSWEARFEPNSYGFRPGRSIHDAIEHCWMFLNGRTRRPWILDADLKSAFDQISHEHILQAIGPVPGRELVKGWLKAGYVEAEFFHETESGAPQGGVISPLLLNVALHGLQGRLGKKFGYVRYADDLIICAASQKDIEAAKGIIEDWLEPRGLVLHPEKTRIVHIKDGFNFLGFSIRHYKGKCLVKPQKAKVLNKLAQYRLWLNKHKQATAEQVIRHFNKVLPGWANNYRHAVSKNVFSYVETELWRMLWRWCKRRHHNKGRKWIASKYFGSHRNANWRFQAKSREMTLYLFDFGAVRIERHVKVKGSASPDDPTLQEYWLAREKGTTTRRSPAGSNKSRSQLRPDARAV